MTSEQRLRFSVRRGIAPAHRREAAQLYWAAFGGKLDRVMGPEPLALSYLDRVMSSDHAFSAVSDTGDLLGIAGFKTPAGALAEGDFDDLRAVFGLGGAVWRAGAMALFSREVENRRFLLDGLCVARDARDRGVGSALVAEICAEALRQGYSEVRLDVIDSNFRARALYDRLGFRVLKRDRMGPLGWLFGFASSTAMVRVLD